MGCSKEIHPLASLTGLIVCGPCLLMALDGLLVRPNGLATAAIIRSAIN